MFIVLSRKKDVKRFYEWENCGSFENFDDADRHRKNLSAAHPDTNFKIRKRD
jgi:hypothetical protein